MIEFWGDLFQLMKDLNARECGIVEDPGRNLFPFALKGILACAPIMRPLGFLILFLPLSFEQGRRRMRKPICRNLVLRTLLDRKLKWSKRFRTLG